MATCALPCWPRWPTALGQLLADRVESVQPPPHQLLCRRLARSPYRGIAAFSRWALGDVLFKPVLYYHAHHADELRIPWTGCGVRRAARLVRVADDFQAPMVALARWLETAPAHHGPRLVDAVVGRNISSTGRGQLSVRAMAAVFRPSRELGCRRYPRTCCLRPRITADTHLKRRHNDD